MLTVFTLSDQMDKPEQTGPYNFAWHLVNPFPAEPGYTLSLQTV